MKRAVGVGVLAAALVSALPLVIAPPAGGGAPPETIEQALAHPHLPGEVLVKFRPEATAEAIGSFRDQLGAATIGTFRSRAERWVLGPGHTVAEAIEILTRSGAVAYAEPNYLVTATAAPDDPRYPELYGLHNTGQTGGTPGADIDAERAWDVSTGSSAVVVAVIDTGLTRLKQSQRKMAYGRGTK